MTHTERINAARRVALLTGVPFEIVSVMLCESEDDLMRQAQRMAEHRHRQDKERNHMPA